MNARAAKSGTIRAALVLAVAAAIAVTVSGCAGPAPVAASSPGSTAGAATSSPMPIEQVVALDPLAEPLVAAGHELVSGTDGFASGEARTRLDVAVQQLEADVQVVQLSMAGGPAASQATPPVDEARIAASLAALFVAVGEVRSGVIDTAARVLNDETPDAEQSVRDDLYLAVVAQQTAATTAATDDTPRQILELVGKVRAVQEAQVAGAAAREAAAQSADDGSGSAVGDSGPTFTEIPYCITWPPLRLTNPVTGEITEVTTPPSGPGC